MPSTAMQNHHQPLAFAGMTEKTLNALFSSPRSATLAPGQVLCSADRPLLHGCLLLTGSVECLAGSDDTPLLHCAAGEYLPPGLGQQLAGFRVVATSQLQILPVDEALYATLDAAEQIRLHQRFDTLAGGLGTRLLTACSRARQARAEILAGIGQQLDRQRALYRDSGAIQGLLQKIPALPPYAGQLTALLLSDRAAARDVVAIARQDPSLTGSVLKTVNSAWFGLQHKVVDFQHAFVLLGFNQLYQLIISKNLQNTMPRTAEFHQLQQHSLLTSMLCFEITHIAQQSNPALLSTIGLLHDIGKSVILLLKRQQPNMAFLLSLLEPGMIGTQLLREWQIPEEVCATLELQQQAECAPPETLPETHRVRLAILRAAHHCLDYIEGNPTSEPDRLFFPDYMRLLGQPWTRPEDFVMRRLLPALKARGGPIPQPIREFIARHSVAVESA